MSVSPEEQSRQLTEIRELLDPHSMDHGESVADFVLWAMNQSGVELPAIAIALTERLEGYAHTIRQGDEDLDSEPAEDALTGLYGPGAAQIVYALIEHLRSVFALDPLYAQGRHPSELQQEPV